MTSNVVYLPTYGKAISLDDQGIYFILNANTGTVQSVFQLVYDDEWYLYQLEAAEAEDEGRWSIMAESNDYSLISMSTTELKSHFSKPEYAAPKGAWQVVRNSTYGFGKFTPANDEASISYAMLLFSDGEMHAPVRIYKTDDAILNSAVLNETAHAANDEVALT